MRQAELYEERALALLRLGEYSSALREITAGLKPIESVTSLEAKQAANSLLARRASIQLQQGKPRDAIAVASRVVADAEPLGPSLALARAYSTLEGAYLFIGQPDKAVYEEKALEIFRVLGDARSAAVMEMNLGVKAYAQGRWGEAARLYEGARRGLERVGNVTQAAYAAANLGEVLISRGAYPEAEAVLTAAQETLRGAQYVYAALFCEIQLARLAVATGDLPTALADLRRILEEARSTGDVGLAVEAWAHLADAITRSGESERALSELAEARRLLDDVSSPLGAPIARIAANALMERGELDKADEELSTAMDIAREQRLVYEEAQALFGLERLARLKGLTAEADAALHEAQSLMQRVSAVLLADAD